MYNRISSDSQLTLQVESKTKISTPTIQLHTTNYATLRQSLKLLSELLLGSLGFSIRNRLAEWGLSPVRVEISHFFWPGLMTNTKTLASLFSNFIVCKPRCTWPGRLYNYIRGKACSPFFTPSKPNLIPQNSCVVGEFFKN